MQEVIMIEEESKFWDSRWAVVDVEFVTFLPYWNSKGQKVTSGWRVVGHQPADNKEEAITNWKLWDNHKGTPVLVKGADLFRRWLEENPSEFKLEK